MNKNEMIEVMAIDSGLSKAEAKRALESFINATTKTLQSGDKLSLAGFGSFSSAQRAERKGRNPQTGEEITIAAKKVVKFKPSIELAEKLN